ncbi:MAG TPA: 4-hydroxythreonine-4-phosphate dehydrogenase, partial [Afipia sp.]|nr:4-hydroxythreonine-4-phosphate dehydrogenase [Afipia sp.]
PPADTSAEDAAGVFADALPVVTTRVAATAKPGQPDGSSAPAA